MSLTLEKIILYPDDDIFDETKEFYHNKIGLEYTMEPTKYWVEFETGNVPIGLHHNSCFNDKFGKSVKRKFFAFNLDNLDELYALYKRLENNFKVADSVYPTDTHRLGILKENKNGFLFLVRDPMGNDVRINTLK